MGDQIILRGVRVHNLKNVNLALPVNALIAFTGVSGSGKTSLAFDTLYAEGQRRYVESLSHYARRQLSELARPELDYAAGLSPTISIEQKSSGRNPRSTVGTMTELYDYMRVLYARVGVPHCPISGEAVLPQSRERIIRSACTRPEGSKFIVLAPYAREKKGEFKEDFQELLRKGFVRVRIDKNMTTLGDTIALDGSVSHNIDIVVDRLVANPGNFSRIAEAITTALNLGNGICSILSGDGGEEELFSMHAYSPLSGLSYSSLEPTDFSFNSPSGMCDTCHGLGRLNQFDLDKILDQEKSIAEDCCTVASSYNTVRFGNIYENLGKIYGFNLHTPWKLLSDEAKKVFLWGTEKKWTRMRFVHPDTGAIWIDNIRWRGVLHEALTRFSAAKSEGYRRKMAVLMSEQQCPECRGERIKPYPAATTVGGQRIAGLTAMTIGECQNFFCALQLPGAELLIAEELIKEIRERLSFLIEVGLHYLTIDRTAPTLSGGEAQRVRLASQLGCGLVGITYILDEPSIGLHHRDNARLIATLQQLRDRGNTVIVVEHDEKTIRHADYVVDVGPGPGSRGGEIVYSGAFLGLLECQRSITADFLTGKKKIALPKKRRKIPGSPILEIVGARHNNLKGIHVKLPLAKFVAITGVSGSGKSSLVSDILFPALSNALQRTDLTVGSVEAIKGIDQLDKVIAIDQSPIGRTPRSNPATYIKLFDDIRSLFSLLPDSRARGYDASRFSFNLKEGACQSCGGIGQIKIDMDFLEDAWVDCTSCCAKRFDEETLAITFKGYNIYDVLQMEVSEALELFAQQPAIRHKLEMLRDVGLEYLKLGQPSTTLSGGEAQRIKLAKELVRPSTGKTLYLLDEPTTGLHFHDIALLLKVLNALVDKGNSVVVIEHNLDIIKTADWIIDLGPEGGAGGGQLIGAGTPESIAKTHTPTGEALQAAMKPIHSITISAAAPKTPSITSIVVEGAEQNNLKKIYAKIPRNKITVCTGPSGSGKSSLAFDTIYAEGQRRYAESLSAYARQFVKQMAKPKVDHMDGLSPAIAIEQKIHAGNPRSTVGTITETYDYLRILFARLGIPHCPETGEEIKAIDKNLVVDRIINWPIGEKIQILAPIQVKRSDTLSLLAAKLSRQGYFRIRLNGTYYELGEELNEIALDLKRKNELLLVVDRIKINLDQRQRLLEAVSTAAAQGGGHVVIDRDGKDEIFNLDFAIESTGKSYPPITPHTFAFNQTEGMCMDCSGLGVQYGANLTNKRELLTLSPLALLRWMWDEQAYHALAFFEVWLEEHGIAAHAPLSQQSSKERSLIFNGSQNGWSDSVDGDGRAIRVRWIGCNDALAKAGKHAHTDQRQAVVPWLEEHRCPACDGERLNALARAVTLQGHTIGGLCKESLEILISVIAQLPLPSAGQAALSDVKEQLLARLRFLDEVGVGYLALERRAPTLSGGEMQRLRLARQLGSGLTGVLYVLDEPTIGLHARDTAKLHSALHRLQRLGNTLILVEHDPLTIAQADYILDFGPAAGAKGGHITARGTLKQIMRSRSSLTGDYLTGRKLVEQPRTVRRAAKGLLKILHAKKHNLKNLSVDIPLGIMTVLSGVSGSGKSTLMHDVLLPALRQGLEECDSVTLAGSGGASVSGINSLDKVIAINQNPIGHTARSDVGTYVDILTRMREFFSMLPASKIKGLQPRHFSCNQRKGMCTACWGMGYRRVEMYFLPPVRVVCQECAGLRLNPVSLTVQYKGKNFGEYLNTTIDEARLAFEAHPRITRILDTLIAVGLGYLTLGQEMASLSGGEAQRIKLSKELGKRATGKTLYLLDEPTTGLHSDDVSKLLALLHKLVNKGNSVLVIEHNLDLIRSADWVIELGPEAGDKGGQLLCCGTPEEIMKNPLSPTAPFL